MNLTPENQSLLGQISQSQPKLDSNIILESLVKNLEFVICKIPERASKKDLFEALARTVRDRLILQLNETEQRYEKSDTKQVNYLSLEYLIGRSLRNNLVNMGIYDVCQDAMEQLGMDLREIEECERDAGLGNGGLGRLAACFLDSMATLQLPAFGYGIRYEYGIFQQKFENGQQIEFPDGWLQSGYPWEIRRPHINYPVRFYGRVIDEPEEKGGSKRRWVEAEQARAVAFDVPISGYSNETVNTLRLWSARAVRDFDLASFNRGDYLQAVMDKQRVETISKVLYPNDQAFSGKELRLKQQYFFVSASLQDMIVRFKTRNRPWMAFPEYMAIQLNDTHPSIAIPELMRLLIDEEALEWDEAWQICRQTFAYTNHTVLPEALERWSVELLNNLLPRHMELIYQINDRFLHEVRHQNLRDPGLLSRVSMIEEGWEKQVRMPFLSIVG
ncbi:MAG: glycogen phosphorylase, partial [Deltaproteobacteria bacterium]|nr:glycogen phosphorylase [Deltaproteobacteria bacterium]